MTRKPIAVHLGAGVMAFLLGAFLFADQIGRSAGLAGLIVRQGRAILQDKEIQWMIVTCFACYFVTFLLFDGHPFRKAPLQFRSPNIFLSILVSTALFRYALAYQTSSGSFMVPVLAAGITFGKAVSVCMRSRDEFVDNERRTQSLSRILVFLLAGAMLWHANFGHVFNYHDFARWNGPWDNPNIYGILMGVGVVLAVGQVVQDSTCRVQSREMEVQSPKSEVQSRRFRFPDFQFPLFSLAAIVCGIGLVKSYSRGAWLATICALAYLALHWFRFGFTQHATRNTPPRPSVFRFPLFAFRFPTLRCLCVLLLSVLVLSFWQFRFTQWRPARRVFSVVNINDFSWRNRVTAWNGALRMMAHRPWFGYGWGEAETVYEKKYLPPNLENGMAIQMNDYFTLGISAGVPALLCFLIYVGLCLRVKGQGSRVKVGDFPGSAGVSPAPRNTQHATRPSPTLDFGPWTLDWVRATCRAGAIVLLVGFWFDGGLFKLATGSVFWILLELGRADSYRSAGLPTRPEPNAIKEPTTRPSTLTPQSEISEDEPRLAVKTPTPPSSFCILPSTFKWLAISLVSLALIETIILVVTPFLPVSKATLTIARHWLIPPKAVTDLDFLAALDLRPSTLHALLEHAGLANYNRELTNWKLDDEIYRNYVLSPDLYENPTDNSALRTPHSALSTNTAPSSINYRLSTSSEWRRRPLWEFFYPPIRHEADPQSAAQIVLKFLHQRIVINSGTGVSPVSPPSTLDAMWHQRKADPQGFEALTVAAFRSVGIPARLNATGQAEIFADGKWQAP